MLGQVLLLSLGANGILPAGWEVKRPGGMGGIGNVRGNTQHMLIMAFILTFQPDLMVFISSVNEQTKLNP